MTDQQKNTLKRIFAERLLALRKQRGLTQVQLAEKAGVTQGSLSHYEKGEREPGAIDLVNIAQALGTTAEALIGGSLLPTEGSRAEERPTDGWRERALTAERKLADLKRILMATIQKF